MLTFQNVNLSKIYLAACLSFPSYDDLVFSVKYQEGCRGNEIQQILLQSKLSQFTCRGSNTINPYDLVSNNFISQLLRLSKEDNVQLIKVYF